MKALLELPDVRAPVRLLSTGNKLKSALLLSLIHKPIVCICHGRKVFDGPKSDFLQVEHGYVLTVQAGQGAVPVLPAAFAWEVSDADVLRLHLRNHADLCTVLQALMPELPAARSVQVERMTLKEKYLALVGEVAVAA